MRRRAFKPRGNRNWQDDELVKQVYDWRIANGACTLRDLAKSTGMSAGEIDRRVRLLMIDGRLRRSATAGSIRATDEVLMRLLPDGRLIEPGNQRR